MVIKEKYLLGGFVLSIIINAFLLGVVVGDGGFNFMPHRPMPFGGPEDRQERMRKDIMSVSPEYRGTVEKIMRGHRIGAGDDMKSVHETFKKMEKILLAPKFDEKALQKLSKQMENHEREMKNNMSGMVMDIAKTLPDAERIKFFDSMIKNRMRGPMMDMRSMDNDKPLKPMEKSCGLPPNFKADLARKTKPQNKDF